LNVFNYKICINLIKKAFSQVGLLSYKLAKSMHMLCVTMEVITYPSLNFQPKFIEQLIIVS